MVLKRRSSSQFTTYTTSSAGSSIKTPSTFCESYCDADDEKDAMSIPDSNHSPSRPLSVQIPNMGAYGPYCPRRPNLREILANTSPPPWTLAAFMAYLSNNHCLETLEFTMDAGRYKKHYAKMMSRAQGEAVPPAKDREYVQALWQRLVEAYIQSNGTREVNLPSDVRDPIVNLKPKEMPPAPETLDPAVAKIYELMEESVLVPFLNSVYPQSAQPMVHSCPYDTSDDSISTRSKTYEESSLHSRKPRHGRSSPPPQTIVQPHSNSYSYSSGGSTMRSRQSASAPLMSPQHTHKSRFSMKLAPTASSTSNPQSNTESGSDATNSASGQGITDDSGSTSSHTGESPMTPPTSPPMSDAQSPRRERDSGMWKKLGRLSGMKVGKKKSHSGLSP